MGSTTLGGNVLTNITSIDSSPTITGTLTITGTGTSTIATSLQAATSTQHLILSGSTITPTTFNHVLLNPYGGNLGIGTTSSWRTFSVTGTVGFSSTLSAEVGSDNYLCIDPLTYEVTDGGATCGASSKRFKKNIVSMRYLKTQPCLIYLQKIDNAG